MKEKPFIFSSGKLNLEEKGGKYFATGYISTADVDLVNDVVTRKCMEDMQNQFKDRVIKLDFEHEAFRGENEFETQLNKTKLPLAKAVGKEIDSKGLLVSWEFNDRWKKMDDTGKVVMDFHKDILPSVKNGFYDAFSIAYIPMNTAFEKREGKSIRLLDRVNLLNVALTGNPVNTSATMTQVMAKSLEYLKKVEGGGIKMPKEEDEKLTPEEEEAKKKKEKESKAEEEAPAEPAPVEPVAEPAPAEETPAEEVKANPDLVEIKSELKSLKEELKSKDQTISELKDFVEKARHKSLGAEDKSQMKPIVKSTGPLDCIN